MDWWNRRRRKTVSRRHVVGAVGVLCIALSIVGGVGMAQAQDGTSELTVQIISTNSPVEAGETVTVTADITNNGSAVGSQDIELAIDGRLTDTTTVRLEAGETRTVELNWSTSAEDVGSYNATVSSENDTAGTDIFVEETAGPFTVGIVSTNSPIVEGEQLTVTADITNNGSAVGSQDIELAIDGRLTDTTTVRLEAGETRTVELAWATEPGDGGTYTANVSSTDDTGETEVQVESDSVTPDSIRVLTQPENTTVGDPIGGPPTVEVTDSAGNPVPNVSVDVSLLADQSSLAGTTLSVLTDDSGRATFDDLVVDTPGSHQLEFQVSEHSINTTSEPFEVVDETPPTARVTVLDTVETGEDLKLDASGSSDNVEIARYVWDFGDGTTITGEDLSVTNHTYDEPGEYTVAVTIVDSSGNNATAERTVVVESGGDGGGSGGLFSLPDGSNPLAVAGIFGLVVAGILSYGWYRRTRRRSTATPIEWLVREAVAADDDGELSMGALTEAIETSARRSPRVIYLGDKFVIYDPGDSLGSDTSDTVSEAVREQDAMSTTDDGSEVVDVDDLDMAALTQSVEDGAASKNGVIAWESYVLRLPSDVTLSKAAPDVNPDELTMDGLTDLVENSVEESRYTWYHPQHWVFVHDERMDAEQTTRNVVDKLTETGAIAGNDGDSADVDLSGVSMAELTAAINESTPSEPGVVAWEDYFVVLSEVESDVSSWD